MTNSRNKGSAFERAIAKELHDLTGISFKREIDQYRAADLGDLVPSDPAWPFVVECKAYKEGNGCKDAWKEQATKAATSANRLPCVVYKYNRKPVRVAVTFEALACAFGAPNCLTRPDEWAEITLDGLAYLAREIMAWRA